MRRGVIVIVATVAGLIAVLSFHTSPSKLTLGTLPGASATPTTPTTTAPAGASPPPTTGPPQSTPTTGASTPSTTSPPTTTTPSATRSATGPSVNYNWGVLSVKVTVTGSKITNVTIASLDDGGNPRSQAIDQQSVPMLEQQAMQAQSSNIQGVSGASYTSAGFQQSLQGALGQLGLK